MNAIPTSELIINKDGTIFHLHLKPGEVSDRIILVGDQDRVSLVASHFDSIELDVKNREFHTITGSYQGKRLTVISHGIGTDNIDIVVNELDALVNIDFETRTIKPALTQLTMVRIGTSGGLQANTPVGSYVISRKSMGFDGLLSFYANSHSVRDLGLEEAFCHHVGWSKEHAMPYVVDADSALVDQIGCGEMILGTTISANGFYGPQGRRLRIPLSDASLNDKIIAFEYNGNRITNFEMESSALSGLSKMLGHKAITVCCIIANRVDQGVNVNYTEAIDRLIQTVLVRI